MTIKLGPHSLIELGDTAAWGELAPAVVKLCFDFSALPYIPSGVLVLGRAEEQFLGGEHPLGQGEPFSLGVEFASTYAPLVAAYPRVDLWEASNEVNPGNPQEMLWYAAFLAGFACEMNILGKRAAIGGWATGTPELAMWLYYVPALEATRQYGAVLTRHCYGPLDEWHAYRYRLDQDEFRRLGYNPNVILSEFGEDAPDPPWRKKFGGDIGRYWREYLKPFTLEINRDDYLLGATVFTVGDGHSSAWHDFDVSGCGLVPLMRNDLAEIQVKESIMAETVTTEGNGVAVAVLSMGTQSTLLEKARAKIAQFMRDLGHWLAGNTPAVVLSDPEAGNRCMLFHSVGDTTPEFWVPTWDMNVFQRVVDEHGIVWYLVNRSPAYWVLAAHVRAKD